MRYLGISVIGIALFATMLSGAALAQTSPGAGSTPGTAGSVRPGTLPSTAPAQTLRSTTGVIQNQQMLDRQPSTIPSDRASPGLSDTSVGGTITTSQQGSGGTPTGRSSRVRDNFDTSYRRTAVISPGQLSYPAAMERQLPKTP
jgi:hypothetical protein